MTVFVTVLLVFLCDQLAKLWVQRSMLPRESISLIPGVFHITYVRNTGAAFGLLRDQTLFFIIITLLVIGMIVFTLSRIPKEQLSLQFALGLLLGGALGNLLDRIRFGYVIDFLDFRVWPVFNLADAAIVVGVGLLLWEILLMDARGS